jgi:hypothetical protein
MGDNLRGVCTSAARFAWETQAFPLVVELSRKKRAAALLRALLVRPEGEGYGEEEEGGEEPLSCDFVIDNLLRPVAKRDPLHPNNFGGFDKTTAKNRAASYVLSLTFAALSPGPGEPAAEEEEEEEGGDVIVLLPANPGIEKARVVVGWTKATDKPTLLGISPAFPAVLEAAGIAPLASPLALRDYIADHLPPNLTNILWSSTQPGSAPLSKKGGAGGSASGGASGGGGGKGDGPGSVVLAPPPPSAPDTIEQGLIAMWQRKELTYPQLQAALAEHKAAREA